MNYTSHAAPESTRLLKQLHIEIRNHVFGSNMVTWELTLKHHDEFHENFIDNNIKNFLV